MAYFNEDNVTEQMCIEVAKKVGYQYVDADSLRQDKSTVIVDSLLQEALMKINNISAEEAQVVIQKVKARIAAGIGGDIITANQNLRKLFFDENSFPFGKDGEYMTINFFDTNPATAAKNNSYVVTNQWEYPKSSYAGGKRLDVVLLINGIPMVIGELKTATKASVTWADGAKDMVVNPPKKIDNRLVGGLEGIFGDKAIWTNKNKMPDAIIRNLLNSFNKLTLSLAACPEDEMGTGYEYLIGQFADDAGHTAQEFYTNRTVVELMAEISVKNDKRI